MNAVESAWVSLAMRLSCASCFERGLDTPSDEWHHIREGAGAGRRAPHLCGIPLCRPCHQGIEGIHGMGTRAFAALRGVDEIDLLGETLVRFALLVGVRGIARGR